MNELEAVIEVLSKKCSTIYSGTNITDYQKGLVGERFCKYGVKQAFFDKGFYAVRGSNKTFTIEEQINPTRSGMGGIDFFSGFEINSNKYRLFVEMKNWSHYWRGISTTIYNDEILDRFQMNDPMRKCYWILAINKRNITYIQSRCISDNINILPVDEQITPAFINPTMLKPILSNFINDFSTLIDDIISGKVKP